MSRGWKFPAKLACQNFERKLSGKGLILDRATDTIVEKIIERLEYYAVSTGQKCGMPLPLKVRRLIHE